MTSFTAFPIASCTDWATARAIERAAAAQGLSVSQFLEAAVRKQLVDTGYLDEAVTNCGGLKGTFRATLAALATERPGCVGH